jgi:alginate O-acetyltransferase complex protein AlgI
MIFTSIEFLLFFLLVLLTLRALRHDSADKWFLLVASYVFYMSWNVACGGLILFTSMTDYIVGRRLVRVEDAGRRKLLLAVSLVLNLGVLAFFKYTNFLYDNLRLLLDPLGVHVHKTHFDIILPAGVSFFTFQSMSYTIDVYRRKLEPSRNLRNFLLFVAFFPQLLAGPIVRAAVLLPQLARRLRASALDIETGLSYFLLGAVKKTVISDQISGHIDLIFSAPGNYDALTLLQGVLGYAIQIYCDFSGYSDMAIGCARMMGYHFPENFQMPYSALNMTEFWRRWHISLSTWLRDYLYISLGGNRLGLLRTYSNLMVTMLLGGLWHGASWNFVLWGALHGLALAAHRFWREHEFLSAWLKRPAVNVVWRLISHCLTLGVVLLGWVFFRAASLATAGQYLTRLLSWSSEGTRLVSPFILPALAGVVLVHLIFPKDYNWSEDIPRHSAPVRILAYASLLILVVCLGATDAAPFIYFQF